MEALAIREISVEEQANQTMEIVMMTISKRRSNARDDLTQMLIAGRWLNNLRERFVYNEWYTWLDENIRYHENPDTNRRYAQRDIRFFKALSPYIAQMQDMGMVKSLENPEREFVDSLSDTHIEVAKNSLSVITQTNVSDLARQIFFDIISDNNTEPVTERHTRKLVETVQAAEDLENEQHQTIAIDMIRHHGVANKDIINQIPDLAENHPEILEEMTLTGNVSFREQETGEVRQIPVSEISARDLEQIVIDSQDEKEHQDKIKDVPLDKAQTVWLRTFYGTPEEILRDISQAMNAVSGENSFKVSLHLIKK